MSESDEEMIVGTQVSIKDCVYSLTVCLGRYEENLVLVYLCPIVNIRVSFKLS